MKPSGLKMLLAVALIAASGCAQPAFSGRPPDNVVSGTVSAVSGTQIVVNGQNYNIKANSPALRQMQAIQVGAAIDLVLNGPPHDAATQVIGINMRPASR